MPKKVHLKIDNWDNVFMKRLNQLLQKDEHCDYNICSATHESFKVHRVVLNACSEYFFSLPNTDTSILIPAHLDFNVVKSIIMFMYTGQLKYTEESRMNVLEVAKMYKVTVLVKHLVSLFSEKKSTTKCHLPLTFMSGTRSALALKKYKPAKKLYCNKLTVRPSPKYTATSTCINTTRAKDVLSENRPIRFECNAEDVPEFNENTFEVPKCDSAPIIKQDNIDSTKTMLKRTSNEVLIDKHNKTPQVQCDTLTPSPNGLKKLKMVSDANLENTNSEVVQDISKKIPHLLQSEDNTKLKILSRNNQSQFENVIINTFDSVEKMLSVSSDIEESLTMHEVKPDIMNIKGPWFCNLCGTDANPLHLESYFMFRRHLVEKHNQKEDAKVCEHCGHVSIYKNLQIHHLYTRHNIQPPAGIKLFKCDCCGFVAVTDFHLKRHQAMKKCSSKSQATYPGVHYTCDLCSRTFFSGSMLKEHLINLHKIDERTTYLINQRDLIWNLDNELSIAKLLAKNNCVDLTGEVLLNDVDV